MARLFLMLSSGIRFQIVVLTNRFPHSSHASGPRTGRHLAMSDPESSGTHITNIHAALAIEEVLHSDSGVAQLSWRLQLS